MPAIPKPVGRDKDSAIKICKNKTCKATFYKSRMGSRFCPNCTRDRAEKKRLARTDRRKREAPYVKPPTEFWNKAARKVHVEEAGAKCEVCGTSESACKTAYGCGLTRDHILAVRFIAQHGLGDPHLDINIKMTCSGCGGVKTKAEVMLFNGNVLGFVRELLRHNWDAEELEMVLRHYNFFPEPIAHLFRNNY